MTATLGALALAGCGSQAPEAGDASAGERSDRLVDFAKKPPYVNALDIDPADGHLLLTTNRGFWRIDPETDEVERMRSTVSAGTKSSPVGTFLELKVTGPGRIVGSGHPDDERALPNFLGYMESDDGGRTWKVVSRLGTADLHKIVLAHDRMYAFDAVLGALLLSTDGGRTFTEQFTPRGLIIDFEVDPDDPKRIYAAGEEQLFRSDDGGRAWRPVAQGEGIRLAWPAPGAFYRAEKDGTIQRSSDGGASWEPAASVPGEPYKFKATGPDSLLLALSDGTVMRTDDGARSWTVEFKP